jgi:hypothetical protein
MKSVVIMALLAVMSVCANSQTTKPIRVTGVGSTFEEAKDNAFAKAIEFEVGAAVLSEKHSRNDIMVRDEIIKYSAGYVEDYKVITRTGDNYTTYITLDVYVKSSKIHERLLGSGTSSGVINGDKLATQYSTYMGQKLAGDKFLEAVLRDAPERGYVVTQGKPNFMLTLQREAVVVVPYSIKWNYNYLTALNEALSKIEDGSSGEFFSTLCMCYKSPERIAIASKAPGSIFGSTKTYHFNDEVRAKQIQSAFTNAREQKLKIKILTDDGKTLHSECFNLRKTFSGKHDRHVFAFWGNTVEEGIVEIVMNKNSLLSKEFNTASRVELLMDTAVNCNSINSL